MKIPNPIFDVSIYGVWFLRNCYDRYYWDKDRAYSLNNTEIIWAASSTNIYIKNKSEQSFVEIISYEDITNKWWG